MKKTLFILIIVLIVALSLVPGLAFAEDDESYELLKVGSTGDRVQNVQQRLFDLRYFSYTITNFYGEFTRQAVVDFQSVNGLPADGIIGKQTEELLFSNDAKAKPVKAVVKPTPKPVAGSTRIKGEKIDWFTTVQYWVSRGDKFKVYDVRSGRTFYAIMVGGYNHVDYEPATSSDTATLLKCYGGTWSWDRRPVIARIGGKYIAASTNGQPHGYETVSGNNMTGQVCMHFLNSRTHGGNMVDAAHQACVNEASR